MRILWLSHLIPYPPKGGVLQRAYNLIKEVSQHHEVSLLAFNQRSLIGPLFNGNVDKGVAEAHEALAKLCSSVEFFEIPNEVNFGGKSLLAAKSMVSSRPYTIKWLESNAVYNRIRNKTQKERFDLVHIDTISLDIFRDAVGEVPCVLDHHNIESHMLKRRVAHEKSALKSLYFWQEGARLERYERAVCPKYRGHITCSNVDAERLLNLTPSSSIEVIPNGVDTSFFKPEGHEQVPDRIVFVGTMNWYPNIEAVRFIVDQILPELRRLDRRVSLHVIGANPPPEIQQLSRYDEVEVLGFVDDVRPFIEQAAVYVCPITDGGGTKLKILDALSMKKAVVANPIASEGINVTNGKDIIFAESPADYAREIIKLLDDPRRREDLGNAARALVEQEYDYKAIGEKLSRYYKQVVGL